VAVSVLAVARRMGERSGWRLSNLALQKLCYIAHMMHLGQYDKPLVFGQFEAWDLGPVHPQLYRALRHFGSSYVREDAFSPIQPVRAERASALVDETVEKLGDNTARLLAITHWENGAWAKNYIPGVKNIPIPNEHIIEEFMERFGKSEGN